MHHAKDNEQEIEEIPSEQIIITTTASSSSTITTTEPTVTKKNTMKKEEILSEVGFFLLVFFLLFVTHLSLPESQRPVSGYQTHRDRDTYLYINERKIILLYPKKTNIYRYDEKEGLGKALGRMREGIGLKMPTDLGP